MSALSDRLSAAKAIQANNRKKSPNRSNERLKEDQACHGATSNDEAPLPDESYYFCDEVKETADAYSMGFLDFDRNNAINMKSIEYNAEDDDWLLSIFRLFPEDEAPKIMLQYSERYLTADEYGSEIESDRRRGANLWLLGISTARFQSKMEAIQNAQHKKLRMM